jgi:sulfur relay protein TusB/DsrH
MIVFIKSGPDTPEGKRGVRLSCEMHADIVLLQNGVYFIEGQNLEDSGFAGAAYVLGDDKELRGIRGCGEYRDVKIIHYDSLVDLMTESDKVIGMF